MYSFGGNTNHGSKNFFIRPEAFISTSPKIKTVRASRVSIADSLGSICSADYIDLNSYDTDVVAMKDCKIF